MEDDEPDDEDAKDVVPDIAAAAAVAVAVTVAVAATMGKFGGELAGDMSGDDGSLKLLRNEFSSFMFITGGQEAATAAADSTPVGKGTMGDVEAA